MVVKVGNDNQGVKMGGRKHVVILTLVTFIFQYNSECSERLGKVSYQYLNKSTRTTMSYNITKIRWLFSPQTIMNESNSYSFIVNLSNW